MDEELTYEQKYDLPVVAEANTADIEYADCGTHRLRISMKMDLAQARELHAALSELPGIEP